MPRRSFVVDLSAGDKAWLDQELISGGFQGYDDLVEKLQARGVNSSTSAVHRYGQQLQRKIDAIKSSTEAAKAIASAAPDDADARSAAVISMVQSDMFDVLMALQEAEDADPAKRVKLISNAARAISDLSRASVNQKRWAAEVNLKLNAAKQAAADQAETIARRNGLSDEDWGAIRAHILGIEVQA